MAEENEKTSLFNPVLVGLLVVAAFFLGNFYTKIQMMEKGNTKSDDVIAEENEEVVATPAAATGPKTVTPTAEGVTTFNEKADAEIIKEDGLPVVYLFSTTWCPHCQWVGETYDSVVTEYVNAGKIKAYHWEIDVNDDTLTTEEEGEFPAEHEAVYKEFNPRGSIPTFVIGGKYFRVGNGHEQADDLEAEAAELRAAIEAIL